MTTEPAAGTNPSRPRRGPPPPPCRSISAEEYSFILLRECLQAWKGWPISIPLRSGLIGTLLDPVLPYHQADY
jgi:hypothetical protein